MKRSKSGAQKRKEAATARDAVAKLPKMTDFFKITEQSRPGTSTERDEESYSVQEKEDYDDQHQSDCEFDADRHSLLLVLGKACWTLS